jgi:hypothetical protein
MAPTPPPETACEIEWEGEPPIRLQPSELFAGSTAESDRIINRWRPRIFDLVEHSISMAKDLCEISWNGDKEPYPCCPYLKLLKREGKDMRRFTDEACHLLLQASSREEILDSHWYDIRTPDARDVMEWMERWCTWLPDEEGQFRFWSIFLPCDALEALYRYVHALVHDYYLEMLELHMEWEKRTERETGVGKLNLLVLLNTCGKHKIHELLVGEMEIWLNEQNAEEICEWGLFAAASWRHMLTEDKQLELVDLVEEADLLCPDPRFS